MRIRKQWFEFAGRHSGDMGVYPVDAPRFSAGARRAAAHTVAGRHGCLYVSDNTLSEFDVTRTLRLPLSRLPEASGWLTGAGKLRFSSRPDALFDARILKNVEFRQILPGDDPLYECSVTFTCQPLPALWPAAEAVVFEKPGEITVPGGMMGLPRVEIAGSGAFSLTIGMQTLYFTGVEDGIILDSELGDALTPDEAGLANDHVTGPFFTLAEGVSAVSWTEGSGDEAGSVSKVTILPRWRYVGSVPA